ncbi:MAG: RNase adapter RapZ [Alphaproteobacteria bacterium]|nr:RNase adapter RapZ [Alphaproteobacteria bacterium]
MSLQSISSEHEECPLIITGLSGAGISSVLKVLEDFKYEVFDNFPPVLIEDLLSRTQPHHTNIGTNIAIGIDTRTRGFSPDSILKTVKDLQARLVYITCDDSVLQKRFTETRRRHPMAQQKSLRYGIKTEREIIEPLKEAADFVIDTSEISIHDLRHILESFFISKPEKNMAVTLMSFGFRKGVPKEADIVMDVRFLKNPYWEKTLKPLTGKDKKVGEYIRQDKEFEAFLTNFKALLLPLLPRYAYEGKSYLTVAVGCTGGKHRSVYTIETLKAWFEEQGMNIYIEHRDLPENNS